MTVRDLVNAYYAVSYPDASPLELGPVLRKLEEAVIIQEQHLVRKLRFQMQVFHPQVFLVNYSRTFGFPPSSVKVAWAVLNDSLCTSACIRHVAHVLAAASLLVAEKLLGVAPNVPSSVLLKQSQLRWYHICDVTERQMKEAVAELMSMYSD